MRISKSTLALVFGFMLFFPVHSTSAYVDPGTGSYVIQILIAGLFGLLFSIKLFWQNIKTFLQGLLSRKKEQQETEEDKSI